MFWTPEAIQDREDIYEYIETNNPAAALALDELFSEKAGLLVDHAGLGKPGSWWTAVRRSKWYRR
nr:type II toxin-antitoxin system RelE/ParE family toxin [Pseudoduganella violacea]